MYAEVKQMAQRALTRLNNVLCRGILTSVTPGKRTAKVSLLNDETYDDIEFVQDWGFISYPPTDGSTELLVSFIRGQRDQGSVTRSFNRKFPPTNLTLAEGEAALYNKVTGTYVHLKADGKVIVKSATEVKIDTPLVTLTGNLSVAGNILDNSATNSHNVAAMRAIFNAHVHSGISPGGSNSGASTTSQ